MSQRTHLTHQELNRETFEGEAFLQALTAADKQALIRIEDQLGFFAFPLWPQAVVGLTQFDRSDRAGQTEPGTLGQIGANTIQAQQFAFIFRSIQAAGGQSFGEGNPRRFFSQRGARQAMIEECAPLVAGCHQSIVRSEGLSFQHLMKPGLMRAFRHPLIGGTTWTSKRHVDPQGDQPQVKAGWKGGSVAVIKEDTVVIDSQPIRQAPFQRD